MMVVFTFLGGSCAQANRGNLQQPGDPAGTMLDMAETGRSPRFLTLADVAEILNTSNAQVYALIRRKDLKAVKIGGRGQWRVEVSALEDYIERAYVDTDVFLDEHPFDEPAPDLAVGTTEQG